MIILLAVTLSAATTAPTPPPVKAASEKQICRKFSDTGSFVRKTKVCRTAKEWRRYEQEVRERGREMQGTISSQQRGG